MNNFIIKSHAVPNHINILLRYSHALSLQFTIIKAEDLKVFDRELRDLFLDFYPQGAGDVDNLCAPVRTSKALALLIRYNPSNIFSSFACFLL